ncbi:hypothetical protein FM106_10095 [Brachybacterium faecium]|nr:hypothetical protein FM106_10095 [Brachybacterium faecium]
MPRRTRRQQPTVRELIVVHLLHARSEPHPAPAPPWSSTTRRSGRE